MTVQLAAGDLGRAFRSSTGVAAYQQFLMRQREEERIRRERQEDIRQDASDLADFAVVAVSTEEIAEFRVELDSYDAATIAALQKNENELAEVRERVDQLLGRAYVLPDGRRVFKTEDGLRVFDEHGTELDASTIDPDTIGEEHPTWEEYKPNANRLTQLNAERDAIFEYQRKLDDARERLDAGDMTREEFDALRDDLKDAMPDAVRAQLPGMEADEPEHAAAADLDAELDFAADMKPASFAAKAAAPGLMNG